MSKSNDDTRNKILCMCLIFLILVKYTLSTTFPNMTFGRLSLDRNFPILENVLLESSVL